MSNAEKQIDNRRESFRIDDTVTLTIRTLDNASYEEISEDFDAFRLRFCMKSHIKNSNELRKPQLLRIRRKDPEIAKYLESLEKQIELMAERLDQSSRKEEESLEQTEKVNLSATGIRFYTNMPLQEGQRVELSLLLNTQNIQVVVLGNVQRVEYQPDNQFKVSVHYTDIHPEDTEALIRHLAKLQQLELQDRRGIE